MVRRGRVEDGGDGSDSIGRGCGMLGVGEVELYRRRVENGGWGRVDSL